jgi:MFS family permease
MRALTRAWRAERLATTSTRMASTAPSLDLGLPVARPPRAARAASTASRGSDLPLRRRFWRFGRSTSMTSTPACGLAQSSGALIGARLVQGLGAAMMTPAALSILTTNFNEGTDRLKALGAWGALAGLSSGVGVFLGGVLSGGPGWRWVFFVNPPIAVLILLATFRLIGDDRRRAKLAHFDTGGAILVTGAMLLAIYALVTSTRGRLEHHPHDRRARRSRCHTAVFVPRQ